MANNKTNGSDKAKADLAKQAAQASAKKQSQNQNNIENKSKLHKKINVLADIIYISNSDWYWKFLLINSFVVSEETFIVCSII